MNVFFLFLGILSGLAGEIMARPVFTAIAVILITIPLIRSIVDDMWIGRWQAAATKFLVMAAYLGVGIWALGTFVYAASFPDRVEASLIVTGAGVIQLAWVFLISLPGLIRERVRN